MNISGALKSGTTESRPRLYTADGGLTNITHGNINTTAVTTTMVDIMSLDSVGGWAVGTVNVPGTC